MRDARFDFIKMSIFLVIRFQARGNQIEASAKAPCGDLTSHCALINLLMI